MKMLAVLGVLSLFSVYVPKLSSENYIVTLFPAVLLVVACCGRFDCSAQKIEIVSKGLRSSSHYTSA